MKYISISTITALAILIFSSCKEKPVADENAAKPFTLSDTMMNMIQIDSVKMCGVAEQLQLSGEVSFDENKVFKVYPRSSGQVLQSPLTLGDKVTAGQTLAVIKSADVAGNYADVSSADADITIAKREVDNQESLYKSGIASEREYNEAKQNYEKALAAKRKITSQIEINGGRGATASGTYILTAPVSGYVVEKNVNQGDFIRSDMGSSLFTISDLKDVWIWANVFEADINKVKEGTAVEVRTLAYPDKVYTGKVDKVSEVLDPSNKAMKVRIKLSNPDLSLKPQMFAKVTVTQVQGEQAVCVPTKSLIELNGKTFVVVFNNKSDMKIAEVDVLKTSGDRTFVNSGVNPGQKVITENELLVFQQLSGD